MLRPVFNILISIVFFSCVDPAKWRSDTKLDAIEAGKRGDSLRKEMDSLSKAVVIIPEDTAVANALEIYLLPGKQSTTKDNTPKEFAVQKEDLPTMPFITDEEVLSFDTSSYKITFKKEAANRIGTLKPSLSIGIPFVLTVDREPVLTGYFVDLLSSFSCAAYVISNSSNTVQELSKGLPKHAYKSEILEKRKNLFLLQALETTGRLR